MSVENKVGSDADCVKLSKTYIWYRYDLTLQVLREVSQQHADCIPSKFFVLEFDCFMRGDSNILFSNGVAFEIRCWLVFLLYLFGTWEYGQLYIWVVVGL